MEHAAVAEAVAIPDESGEKACYHEVPVTRDKKELNEHPLVRSFVKWQSPERYECIDAISRTSTGKFSKVNCANAFRSDGPRSTPQLQLARKRVFRVYGSLRRSWSGYPRRSDLGWREGSLFLTSTFWHKPARANSASAGALFW
ncbi:hypothetical protein [Bradyrhizobium icense]|uniref:hypothetical protein n=1 Tax=Bradyrhizobium icense TaxID=1274631 RepID=UPI0012EA2735